MGSHAETLKKQRLINKKAPRAASIQLNQEQQAALDKMIAFCTAEISWFGDGADNMFVLQGYAGTGKSTTIQFLIEKLHRLGYQVACTAPTNKATKVLDQMARQHGLFKVTVMTIHRMLGLSVVNREDTEILDRVSDGFLSRYQILVIDEASMINENLYRIIAAESTKHEVRIVFVGDPKQLPPVGETDSRVFELHQRASLDTIIRQAADNPIIGLSKNIRDCIDRPDTHRVEPDIATFAAQSPPKKGVFIKAGQRFNRWMPDAFLSERFKRDQDAFRIVAWTNRRVDQLNAMIHELIYPGQRNTPFCVGETVAFRKPLLGHGKSKSILIATDEEVTVQGMSRQFNPVCDMEMWSVIVKQDNGESHEVFYLGAGDLRQYGALLKATADAAKLETNKKKRFDRWASYYAIKNSPSPLSLCYALTVHRAQGSTFGCVFIDAQDILRNPNRREALRLLYVAVTRASQSVIINW